MTRYQGVNFHETVGGYPAADRSTIAAFFNVVYAWMAAGLGLTAVVAWYVSTREDIQRIVFNLPVLIGLVVVQLALVWVISAAVNRISATTATALFMVYSALMGLTLSFVFLRFTGTSIATTFVVTAGMFAAMSVYGMVTKRDLTAWGSLLFMALIGIIIASVVNIFLRSPILYWAVTYIGVIVFVGLTAYDTQKLKEIAIGTAGDTRLASRLAISGALALYLDFINLFLYMLRILGVVRGNDD